MIVMDYVRNFFTNVIFNYQTSTDNKQESSESNVNLENEFPPSKKMKLFQNSSTVSNYDMWKENKNRNVRIVPIQVEEGFPSTSTPNISTKPTSRMRLVPIEIANTDIQYNGQARIKPRTYNAKTTPARYALIDEDDNDDDDDDEVTIVETTPQTSKFPSKTIELEECPSDDDDVLIVEPKNKFKFFMSKNNRFDNNLKLYRVKQSRDSPLQSRASKICNKFKSPSGISKTYKRPHNVNVPKWMQQKPKHRNLMTNKIFNLDEKRDYLELLKRQTTAVTYKQPEKNIETINLEESNPFHAIRKEQRHSLDNIKRLEKSFPKEKQSAANEYDPITIASISSLSSSDSEDVGIEQLKSFSSAVKIDSVNSLKDSYKNKPVTSIDWLATVNDKYRQKKQRHQGDLQDIKLTNDIITKVNLEQKRARAEQKLKYDLSIPEILVESEAEFEFPPLTAEQEKLVNRALGPGPASQVLVEKFNYSITRRDLQTLAGLNWLNDEVINFYMNLLMQRSEKRPDLPKVYAATTFFYPRLLQSGQTGVRRWTKKVDIFSFHLMVVPVHLGVHWCLSLIDFRQKRISYLDSMGGRNQQCLDALMKYLKDEHQDKKGAPFACSGWKTESLRDVPQQMNGSDCGMFACTFAEFAARDAPFAFSQQHMPYLRRKAALEILRGELLL